MVEPSACLTLNICRTKMSKKEIGPLDSGVRIVRILSWVMVVLFWVLIMFFPFYQWGELKDIAERDRKIYLKQLEDAESLLDKVRQKTLIVESLNSRPR